MNIARAIYEKTAVGAEDGTAAAPGQLEPFQAVVGQFDDLQDEGLIEITLRHEENQTGNNYIDVVRFRRLQ